MLNDRQLLEQLKLYKKQKDYEILYKRYLPMINKYAYKISSSCGITFHQIKEEFQQDAFISLVEAVDYVDLEKIEDDNWKFQNIFYYFLKSLQLGFYKDIHRDPISLDHYQEKLENPEDIENESYSGKVFKSLFNVLGVSSNHYNEFNECRDQFLKTLTSRQQQIIKYRQLGMTISEIGKELNISFGTVHRDIYLAKKEAVEIFIFD